MDLKEFKRLLEGITPSIANDYFNDDDNTSYILEMDLNKGYSIGVDLYGSYECRETYSGSWENPPEYDTNLSIEADELIIVTPDEEHLEVTPEIKEYFCKFLQDYFCADEVY